MRAIFGDLAYTFAQLMTINQLSPISLNLPITGPKNAGIAALERQNRTPIQQLTSDQAPIRPDSIAISERPATTNAVFSTLSAQNFSKESGQSSAFKKPALQYETNQKLAEREQLSDYFGIDLLA